MVIDMNTKNLEYFIQVVDLNSFTKAAEECFISQSAISQAIKSLEEELGFSLMIRSKKGFDLTPAGRYLYLEGKNIIHDMKDIATHASFISQNNNQTLRVGYVVNYGYHELKKALMLFSKTYPEIALTIRGGCHDVISTSSIHDMIDLFIGDQRKPFSELYNNIYLGNLYYTIRVSNASSLSSKSSVTIDDLRDYHCILIENSFWF